ncbi:MAG: aminotransferase class IV [Pseudomonadota bacterium]
MNSEITESFFILNSRTMPSVEADKLPQSTSRTIYEVLRVTSGIPVFLERHLERLESSARLVNSSVAVIRQGLTESINELIKTNGHPDKNIKILVYNLDNATPDYMAFFIKSSYPSEEEYKNGVHAILIHEERTNPNAKIVNSSYKERVAEAMSEAKAYEALLVNNRNEITEGSRSNVFFVRGDEVLTAPKGNVLIGITRVCVMELCEKLGIKVSEIPICVDMLKDIDGLFMSGTSPKLLPISTIGDMAFESASNPVIRALMKGYDDMLSEYIYKKRIG